MVFAGIWSYATRTAPAIDNHNPTSFAIALSASSSGVTFLFPSFLGLGSFPSRLSRQIVISEQPPSFCRSCLSVISRSIRRLLLYQVLTVCDATGGARNRPGKPIQRASWFTNCGSLEKNLSEGKAVCWSLGFRRCLCNGIEVVRPPLHHPRSFFEAIAPVVGTLDLVLFGVGQRALHCVD